MRHLTLAVVLSMSACGPEDPSLDTAPLIVDSEPARVAFVDLDPQETYVSPVDVTFQLTVADQAPASVPLVLSSSLDGELWSGNVPDLGVQSHRATLRAGSHQLALIGTDRHGNTVSDEVAIQVRANRAPACRILTPTDQFTVARGVDLLFEASVDDPEGDAVEIRWRSSVEGGLALGDAFVRRMREVGTHEISVQATDTYGASCTDVITLVVE